MRWCTKTNEVLGGRARGTTVEAAAAARLQVGALAQAADRRAHLRGLRSVHRVRAAREHLFARLALPDPHRRPLHGVLPAEEAREARVLGDLDLLHLLAERRAVPDTVLAGDPDLLCPLLRLRGAGRGAGGSARRPRWEAGGAAGGAAGGGAAAARAGRRARGTGELRGSCHGAEAAGGGPQKLRGAASCQHSVGVWRGGSRRRARQSETDLRRRWWSVGFG